jgi:hypothetical protein
MKTVDVVQYFMDKGYKPHQAAAIAGNLTQESSLNPEAINPKSGAFGLGQFLGPRKKALYDYAERQGSYASDPGTQLDFIDHELNTTERKAKGKLMAATNLADATNAFSNHYERAGAAEKNNAKRVSFAENALNSIISTASASEQPYQALDSTDYSKMTDAELQALVGGQQAQPIEQPPQATDYSKMSDAELQALIGGQQQATPAQSQVTPQPQTDPGVFDTLKHKAGVAGRGIIEGAVGIPDAIANTLIQLNQGGQWAADKLGIPAPLKLPNTTVNVTEPYGTAAADTLGLPTANENDNIIYPASKVMGGFALPSGVLSKGGTIANIAKQIPGILSGQTAQEAVKQGGGGEGAQIAANVLGSVLGGGALSTGMGMAKAVGRTATGGVGTRGGLEAVAGRTLNRAAGSESPDIIANLTAGVVPTIARPIRNYAPTTSEIAGNPGVSTIMRQAELYPDNLSALGARSFGNKKAVTDYLNTRVGSDEIRGVMEQKLWDRTEAIAKPMRERNLPVDTAPIYQSLDQAIAKHEGNTAITKVLEDLKRRIPGNNKFNVMLNFKQGLDQDLRAPAFADPQLASLQRASSALKGVKKAITETLTVTEPGFKDYVQRQAKGMTHLKQSEAASAIANKSRLLTPITGMVNGVQDELFPLSAAKLESSLRGKAVNSISPRQINALQNARQHMGLGSRSNSGLPTGSATAQNLNVRDMVYGDIMRGGFGENPGVIGKAMEGLGKWTGGVPGIKNLTNVMADSHARDLSAIFTRAQLDPAYAAKLMKDYGLGHMSFADPAGRAALRGIISGSSSK